MNDIFRQNLFLNIIWFFYTTGKEERISLIKSSSLNCSGHFYKYIQFVGHSAGILVDQEFI